MDNPQYYQPLSHALHPPRSAQGHYPSTVYKPTSDNRPEDDDTDDDDEGMVEEQLNRNDQASDPSPSSPRQKAASTTEPPVQSTSQPVSPLQEAEPKRRPGRPRGSKNRRTRASTSKTQPPQPSHPPLHPSGQATNPPQLPEVNAQNQQYYEFQWRVLNLCAEFYGAAEELVKATPALVIAQCYQMGPGSKVDPISMLTEAKRNCDTLLANPSQLISSPPPPLYPVVPPIYQPPSVAPMPAASGSSSKSTTPATVINQPQSFVVSMGTSYPVYASTHQYPTTPYYQYSYAHPGPAFYAAPPVQAAPSAQPTQPSTQPTATVPSSVSGVGNQGTWSDEETERLRKLAEEYKGSSGEIDWDRVVTQWGNGRTRHQILIKATQMGLKESSTGRGVKRRRETEGPGDAGSPATPSATTVAAATSTSSPSSTPVASPSIQNQQRPPTTKGATTSSVSVTPAPTTASNMPWPMPTVAAPDHRSTSYYRPRPTETSSKPPSGTQLGTSHHYMYQPNGRHESSK